MIVSDAIERTLQSIGKVAREEPVSPALQAEGLDVVNELLQRLQFPPITLTDSIPLALEEAAHFRKALMKEMADAVRGQITGPQLAEGERSLSLLLGRHRPFQELSMPARTRRRRVP